VIYDETPLGGSISDYEESVQLVKVDETRREHLWDEMVAKYHYLGYEKTMGARVKYLVMLGKRPVGAIGFVSATPRLEARDKYIGWSEEERASLIQCVVNNNRFLILPWVSVRNLASHVLSESVRRLKADWPGQYGCDPCVVETFVDTELYSGSCYVAANWTYLGETKGYGKVGKSFVRHGRKKSIYALVINRRFAKRFRPRPSDPHENRRKEALVMLESIPNWKDDMFARAGITGAFLSDLPKQMSKFLDPFMKCLKRPENRANMAAMVKGLMSDLERKSVEPVALAYMGASRVRSMQRFMSDSVWDDGRMLRICQSRLADLVSCDDGMLTVDGTDFPKKGGDSAGVQRQYCGRLGKVDNCQASVMLGYASDKGYGPVHRALYVPECWFDEAHSAKRARCGIPEGCEFKTKNRLAAEMIGEVVSAKRFGVKWVGADASFGSDTGFLDAIPDGLHYFADVRSNQMVFLERPAVSLPEYAGRGRRPYREAAAGRPTEVRDIAADDRIPWVSAVLADGAKGPITASEKCTRVVEIRKRLPAGDSWLYIRKDADGNVRYSLCNAPADTDISTLRRLSVMRWSIEQCFEECKRDLGMDHNECRSWNGWNRHVLLVFIAHLFLNTMRLRFGDTLRDGVFALKGPVSAKAFSEGARGLLNEGVYPSIFAGREAKFPFLTLPAARDLVCSSIPKVGCIIDRLAYNQKSYCDAHISAWNKRAQELMSKEDCFISAEVS